MPRRQSFEVVCKRHVPPQIFRCPILRGWNHARSSQASCYSLFSSCLKFPLIFHLVEESIPHPLLFGIGRWWLTLVVDCADSRPSAETLKDLCKHHVPRSGVHMPRFKECVEPMLVLRRHVVAKCDVVLHFSIKQLLKVRVVLIFQTPWSSSGMWVCGMWTFPIFPRRDGSVDNLGLIDNQGHLAKKTSEEVHVHSGRPGKQWISLSFQRLSIWALD